MEDRNNGGIKINNVNLNLSVGGIMDIFKDGLESIFGKVFDKIFEEYYRRKLNSDDD
ncbi:MAG: hypothetical protein QXD03_02015 [Candidatus Anstonellales archaeon]